MTSLELKSSSFSDGDEIPKKYGYKHGNENPPLLINGIPSETKSLAKEIRKFSFSKIQIFFPFNEKLRNSFS